MSDSDFGTVTLREPERSFLGMVQDSPLPIYIWRLEPGDRLVFAGANPAADRVLSFTSQGLAGMTLEEVFPTAIGTDIPAAFRRVATHGGSWSASEYAYSDGRVSGIFEVHAYRSSPGVIAVTFS